MACIQDKDFDGDPVQIYEPPSDGPVSPPEQDDDIPEDDPVEKEPPIKYRVRGVEVKMLRERVQYLGKDGKLITESFVDYSRENLLNQYPTLEKFLEDWFSAERKDAIVRALLNEGVFLDKLQDEVGMDIDPFDLICHIAYDKKPLTRSERAKKVKNQPEYFEKYGDAAQSVIDALLRQYAEDGYETFDKVLDAEQLAGFLAAPPLNELGRPLEVLELFGGKEEFQKVMLELQNHIYSE